MDGSIFENAVTKYIKSALTKKIKEEFPELSKYNYLCIDDTINLDKSSLEDLKKAENALFLIKLNKFTSFSKSSPTTVNTAKGAISANSANRDLVIYELCHDPKTGKLLYNFKGLPKYKPIPLANIECKVSYYLNYKELVKKIKQKLHQCIPLSTFENSVVLVKNLFTWMNQAPEIKQQYPNFKLPDFSKELILPFFTSTTQQDNSFALVSYEDTFIDHQNKKHSQWTWAYLPQEALKQNAILCPEITPQLLKIFNNSSSKPKQLSSVQKIIDKILAKNSITKKDRSYFKLGSDQQDRSLFSVEKTQVKPFATCDFNFNILSSQDSFITDLYNFKNNNLHKSCKDIAKEVCQNKFTTQDYVQTYQKHYASNSEIIEKMKQIR